MNAIIIMVILVCGYLFTESHYRSRVRKAKENGWELYFFVALKGCIFFAAAGLTVITLFFCLFILSWTINIIGLAFSWIHVDLYTWAESEWMNLPLLVWFTMLLAISFSISQSGDEKKRMQHYNYRLMEYQHSVKSNNMENLIFQSIKEKKLVSVSLKSRKVYVGYITAPRFEHSEKESISIIPYISGYRDKETLEFISTTNYYELYLNENITFDSEPLKLNHFRHIIPMEHIEFISIFDIPTYRKFRKHHENKSIEPARRKP